MYANEVNTVLPGCEQVDDSQEMISNLLRIGTRDLIRLAKVCKEFDRPVPVLVKLVYDVTAGKLDAKYEYDQITSSVDVASFDLFESWMKEESLKRNE